MRKFQEVEKKFLKFPDVETVKPSRSDRFSAGYDFYSKETHALMPGQSHVFWTDVKAICWFDNVLMLFARSGLGTKKGVVPRNCVGIIDASYAGNEANDGNIGICLQNNGNEPIVIEVGDRIAQGIFTRYLITDDDPLMGRRIKNNNEARRKGGFGSSSTTPPNGVNS